MWFTNLRIYRFTKPFTITAEALAELLTPKAFKPCGKMDLSSYGWVSPLGRYSDELVHATNGNLLICARKEEKILPSAVINEAVSEKVLSIEEEQGRNVRRKERNEIKDDIIHNMLPKAFTRSQQTFAYISPKDNLLVINASSTKYADELLSYLRTTLGSLPVVPPSLKQSPINAMTRWLADNTAPEDIVIDNECELRSPGEEGSIIRCKRQDLAAEEIHAHLEAGKLVTKLSITWQDSLSCLINDDLSIKRLRFSEGLIEQSKDIDPEDTIAKFDNDFSIMTLELARFIPRLFETLGGEDEEAYQSDVEQAA